jgi:hypothetical protein
VADAIFSFDAFVRRACEHFARNGDSFMTNALVGYQHPPQHSRFKPGRSGNPNGRPKKRVGIRDELLSELNEAAAGEPEFSKGRAIMKELVRVAAAGNLRAAITVLQFCPDADAGDENSQSATADGALLAEYVERELRRRGGEETGPAADAETDKEDLK